jgi:hypothetical protein
MMTLQIHSDVLTVLIFCRRHTDNASSRSLNRAFGTRIGI